MAKDTKATATPTAPATPPAAPATPPVVEKEFPKVKGHENFQWIYADEKSAVEAAHKLDGGPRRAWKVTVPGHAPVICLGGAPQDAARVCLTQLGATIEELGAKERAKGGGKAPELDVAALFAIIMAKPEAERKALTEQLASKGINIPTPPAKS